MITAKEARWMTHRAIQNRLDDTALTLIYKNIEDKIKKAAMSGEYSVTVRYAGSHEPKSSAELQTITKYLQNNGYIVSNYLTLDTINGAPLFETNISWKSRFPS